MGKLKVADALRRVGARVEVHDDRFSPDARDEDWLREVGLKGWIVFTRDQRIRHRKLELSALLKARVAAFVFTGGNVSGEDMANTLKRSLPAILRFVRKYPRPFIASIVKSGRIQLLLGGPRKGGRKQDF